EMHNIPVLRDRFMVVVPPNHPFASQSVVAMEALRDEPLIISKGRYELSIMSLFTEREIIPNIKYEFSHPSTALSFIRQGLGIALLPELILKNSLPDINVIPLAPVFYRDIFLVTPHTVIKDSPFSLLQQAIVELKIIQDYHTSQA